MLFDLKIETIGKVMFGVLLLCMSVVAFKFLPMQFTQAANGENASISLVPENGIAGSNRLKVMFTPNLADVQKIQSFKLVFGGTVAISSFEKSERLSGWNMFSSATNTFEFFTLTPSDNGLTGTGSINLGTVVVTTPSTGSGNISFASGTEFLLISGSTPPKKTPDLTATSVNVNAGPSVAILTNGAGVGVTGSSIVVNVSDTTDNIFTRNIAFYKEVGTTWISQDFGETYETSGFPVNSSFTHAFNMKSNKSLDYSKKYKFVITVTDDQGAFGSNEVSFTTQRDTGKPNKVAFANMTKSIWSSNPADKIIDVVFNRVEDSTPAGKIKTYYIFKIDDIGGFDAFSFDINTGYFGYADENQSISTIRTAIGAGDYMASFDQPLDPTQNLLTMSIAKSKISNQDYMATTTFILVVTDDARSATNLNTWEPNISDPVMVMKQGDYVMGEYRIPDGVITLDDVIYSFRNSTYPSSCPIPAKNGGNLDGTIKSECK